MNLRQVPEDHQASNGILELTDISRPRIFGEERDAVFGKLDLLLVLLVIFVQEELREDGDRLPLLPEGGTWISTTLRR